MNDELREPNEAPVDIHSPADPVVPVSQQDGNNDSFIQHQKKAGRAGGRSRSMEKRLASQRNIAKARLKRHNPNAIIPPT